jgi:hypothetical protein
VVIAGLGLAMPATATATVGWSSVAPMGVARAQQSSTLLPDGEVLVAGGYNGFVEKVGGHHISLAGVERFDPATGSWIPAAPMHVARSDQTATLLGDGEVLVIGGWEEPASGSRTAEMYDPATDTWTAVTPPPELQYADTATLLDDGDVLLTGQFGTQEFGGEIGAVEFLPGSDTWVSVPAAPSAAERDRTAVALPGGEVLLAGGVSYVEIGPPEHAVQEIQTAHAEAEVFDPTSATWTPVAAMHVARIAPTATPLPGGQVLVTGGLSEISAAGSGAGLASTESFDPATGTWTAKAPMLFARGKHSASLLPDGRVLVAGGSPCGPAACISAGAASGCCAADTAETYDPTGDAWAATEPVLTLSEHAASVLPDGSVLVSGGNYDFGSLYETSAAEIYGNRPPPVASTAAAAAPSLRLWDLHQSRRRWREPGRSGGHGRRGRQAVPLGSSFGFELSEPAEVTLHFRGAGGPAKGCRSRQNGGRSGACPGLRPSGVVRIAGHAGADQVHFDGRLEPRGRLAPGHYKVSAVAVAVAGGATSRSQALGFRIIGGAPTHDAAGHRPAR